MHQFASPRARTVAVAVALVSVLLAACGGDDDTGGDGGAGTAPPPASGAAATVVGTDTLKWEPADLEVEAGQVTITVEAGSAVNHTFVIEELDDLEVVAVGAGKTESGTVDLEAGTYTFYCSVAGHRSGGMEGTLTVA